MAAIKTRIWQGGLAGITGDPAHAPVAKTELPPSESQTTLLGPTLHEPSLVPPAPSDFGATRPYGAESAASHPRGATQVLGWWDAKSAEQSAARERMAATRIVPIEELLGRDLASVLRPEAELGAQKEQPRAANAIAAPASKLDERRGADAAPKPASNRLRIVLLLALLAVAAFLVSVPPGSTAPAPALRTTTAPIKAPSRAPSPTTVAATPAANSEQRTVKLPGQERAAIDALVAGDYARAHRLYSELALTLPAPSAFSEAARILAERAHATAVPR